MIEQAIFAAGCFWEVQASFDALPGVLTTVTGYTGGTLANPDYEQVCTDTTGHAEAVRVDFDNRVISYETLLDAFFNMHDPTTLNRQGPDIGTQYRSTIFYLNDQQKEQALIAIKNLNKAKRFLNPIVTQVVPAGVFYPAESMHQKYFEKQNKHTCAPQTTAGEPAEDYFRHRLTPEQYFVLREKGTEPPFSGKYLDFHEQGIFVCAACGNPLFDSRAKFDSGSGWPSFDAAISQNVRLRDDLSHGLTRTEVSCARCGSHLGHVFQDGPTPSGLRYCINSAALNFKKTTK